MSNLDDEFMAEMLADFLDESEGYLSRLNENVLEIDNLLQADEAAGCSIEPDKLNEMFRDAHSLKGLSAMLQLGDINRLTHKLENVFDAARHNTLAVSKHVVEVIFHALDRLTGMIECLSDNPGEIVEYETVVEELTNLLQPASKAAATTAPESTPETLAAAADNSDEAATASSESVTESANAAAAATAEAESNSTNPADAEMNPADVPESDADAPSANDTAAASESTGPAPADPFVEVVDATEIPDKYLTIFMDETDESLDELAEILEASGEIDLAQLLALGHRIKGSAASIGLNRAARMTHVLEDLIQDLRDAARQPDTAQREAFMFAVDCLKDYLQSLRDGAADTTQLAEAYLKLQALDEQAREAQQQEAEASATGLAPTAGPSAEPAAKPDGLPAILEEFIEQCGAIANNEQRVIFGALRFLPQLPLVGIKARLIMDRLADIGQIFDTDPAEECLEDMPKLDCLCFALITAVNETNVQNRLLADGILETHLKTVEASSGKGATDPGEPATPDPNAGPAAPAAQQTAQASNNPVPADKEKKDRPIETIRVDIDRLDHLMNQAGQLVINKARFARLGEQFKSLEVHKQSAQTLQNATELLDKIASDIEEANSTQHFGSFVGAVGSHVKQMQEEMETLRAELNQLREARSLVNDLGEAVHQLDRVSEGIQKSVMDTRMVPIGPLFSRFKRVVRDYTKGSGKDIRLVIRGDKTELDKRMIDELGDPLIHMVRNSADHGIEPPEDREKAGKPKQGSITLDAFHRGNQVVVQVQDDGRGLDPEKLKAKAISKGIITPEEAERLTRQQAFQLIWEPGFSTAEKVTEISGRGMGMDIVHSKLEKLNGSVELDSQLGQGTTITVKLPLTIAILPSLLTVIRDDVFAIPVESVLEIVRLKSDQLSTIHQARTAVIRGRVISVVELRELLQFRRLDELDTQPNEYTLVIIGTKGNELGLMVDGLLGEEDIVIKSLAENYRNVTGLAGASILGDGRVSLILDVSAIVDLACHHQLTAAATVAAN